jgi:hypothetical protein
MPPFHNKNSFTIHYSKTILAQYLIMSIPNLNISNINSINLNNVVDLNNIVK